MLYQFLKISYRNITRHKFFSAINILGLMLSITICIPVMMIVNHQFEFDNFHPHPDQTFRVISNVNYENGQVNRYATTPVPLAEALKEYEFVESTVPIYRTIFGKATTDEKTLHVSGAFTNPDFFKLFGFKLASGSPQTALSEPYSIILTQKTAKRFFGATDPLGERFSVEGIGDFTITGVLEELPTNTHFRFGLLASMNTVPLLTRQSSIYTNSVSWENFGRSYTYVLAKDGTSKKNLLNATNTIANQKVSGLDLGEHISSYSFEVQNLSEISPGQFLRSDMGAGIARSLEELFVLMGIALVILLMACFNYTNLSIARAIKRAKEVGVYKVFGAGRWQIIFQFVLQSTLMAIAAMILAYALLPWIPLPQGFMTEVQSITPDLSLLVWFLAFAVFTGFLAGFLPAWLISSLNPVKALKNIKSFQLMKGINFRKGLVVIQFTLSVVLLIVTAAIYQQSQYVATADYGFQRENMIDLDLQEVDHTLLKDELTHISGVQTVSAISDKLGTFTHQRVETKLQRSDEPISAQYISVDQNAIPNLNLELLAGSNFPSEISVAQNSQTIIVNESFAELYGWQAPIDAVGNQVWIDDSTQVEINGVIKDFNFESMSVPIRPLVLGYQPEQFRFLNIQYAASDGNDIRAKIEAIWSELAPKTPINLTFTDQFLYETHSHKEDMASFSFYAFIALVIASLGLLGMVTYTVEIRTQEVGVRKILGASVSRIIGLLSKEFIVLLGIAAFIGLPVGYWLGVQFINSYAYQIDIGFGTLTLGLSVLLLVGVFAIGTQTWKVATSNPVEALRSE